MAVNRHTEMERAERVGHRVSIGDGIPYVMKTSPMSPRGAVYFYLLRHGWTCGECGDRVTISRFNSHAKNHV